MLESISGMAGEAKGAEVSASPKAPLLFRSIGKFNPNTLAFKHALELTSSVGTDQLAFFK